MTSENLSVFQQHCLSVTDTNCYHLCLRFKPTMT